MATPDSVSSIRALREHSNSAIVARDAERVVALMMPDVTVSVAGGPLLAGREASRLAFAEQFADTTFRGYVRDAVQITAHDGDTRATERGRWYGRWRHRAGDEVVRGTYVAEWRHTDMGWFIQSETFTIGG